MIAMTISAQTSSSVNSAKQTAPQKTAVIQTLPDRTPEGVVAVDLGLPSGTLWADRNLGAKTDLGIGVFVAWGETTPNKAYSWAAYKLCNGKQDKLTKYNNDSAYGIIDGKNVLEQVDDAASANWGDKWTMPTVKDVQELIAGTTCRSVTAENGVNGMLLTSKTNGNFILLPAGGYRDEWYSEAPGSAGYYWTASVESSIAGEEDCTLVAGGEACTLYFMMGNNQVSSGYSPRMRGLSIRPVKHK